MPPSTGKGRATDETGGGYGWTSENELVADDYRPVLMEAPRLEEEIREQPEALERLLAGVDGDVAPIAAVVTQRPHSYVLIAARGTSDNAARYAQYLFDERSRCPWRFRRRRPPPSTPASRGCGSATPW
jgi:hypothetical protein